MPEERAVDACKPESERLAVHTDGPADLYDLTLDQVDAAIRFELIAGAERAA